MKYAQINLLLTTLMRYKGTGNTNLSDIPATAATTLEVYYLNGLLKGL